MWRFRQNLLPSRGEDVIPNFYRSKIATNNVDLLVIAFIEIAGAFR